MKPIFIAIALATSAAAAPAFATDVGVSISFGQPGFYGQIDLGNMGRPPVIYGRPVMIERARNGYSPEPVYLRVPPGQARNWRRHCGTYNACGRPVYFVNDDWYNKVYSPRYRSEHGGDHHDDRNERRDDEHYDKEHHDKEHHDNGNDGHRGN